MENLMNEKKCGWLKINEKDKQKIYDFNDEYIKFLRNSKIEREFINNAINELKQNNFKDINLINNLKKGDKVYYNNRNKALYAAVIGNNINSLNIVGAHVDSPRLDLKPNPLYEESDLCLFKTHYYGGIKKYQWNTIPFAIHGVIVKSNGEKINVAIGEGENDPIFTITDLLVHLSKKQLQEKAIDVIEGEDLNLLVGSIPLKEKEKNAIKLNILSLLNKKYGITEIDFTSSELELVPAFQAKSLGFDESMVASYGQDDKSCAYCALQSIKNINPSTTSILILSDKEEIGSVGNTGMYSHNFDYFISQLLTKSNQNDLNKLEEIFTHSKMLSADVDGAIDPTFQSVNELHNNSKLGYGVVLNKYTGAGGKSGASDANAEYVAFIRGILEKNNILYQVSELGKIGAGGGGTIAYILANKGIDVIDCGVPILSMHSPYEVTSKFDIYEAYKTYKAFYEK